MSDTDTDSGSSVYGSKQQTLQRRREGSVLTGVCFGMAEALELDVTLIRIAWIIGSLASPWASIAYVVLAFVLPLDEQFATVHPQLFFDGDKLIVAIKRSARALMAGTLERNQRAFRRAWDRQLDDVCRAWKEAIDPSA